MADQPCDRCGGPTPTTDNIADTSFWGAIETSTTTTVTRSVRFLVTYFRRNPRLGGSPLLRVDERQALCDGCWGDLVGRFMQGRSVDALPGKEGR